MSDPLDKTTTAALIKYLREEEMSTAYKVALINIIWSVYDADMDAEPVSEAEADAILAEMPTSYDEED